MPKNEASANNSRQISPFPKLSGQAVEITKTIYERGLLISCLPFLEKQFLKMKLFIAGTYTELSKQAANDVIIIMQHCSKPLLCVASGDSPVGLYKELVNQNNTANLDVSNWCFVGLDEWVGMNKNDEGSCQYYVQQQLFQPLNVSEERICFFNGRTAHPEKECQQTEAFIQQHGGIDMPV